MSNVATVKKQPNAIVEVRHQLAGMEDQFKAALPAHIPVERFSRVVMTAVQNNPELLECDRRSLWNSAMKAAQDGLLPDGREGAMVVRKDKKSPTGKAANWQPMIAGIRKKARNSGEIATWDAHEVYENDEFEFELGDDPFIRHKPTLGDQGKIIAAYSICVLKSGEKTREVMGVGAIHKIRDRSDAWKAYKANFIKTTPWQSDEGEMCRKTVARRHSKVIPMSSDLDDLIRRDDELYNMADASDKVVKLEDKRPASLGEKLDAIAGNRLAESDAGEVIDAEVAESNSGAEPETSTVSREDTAQTEGAEDEPSQSSAPDGSGDELSLLDLARSKSLDGRRTFDAFYNSLTSAQQDELEPEMQSLMKAAKQVDTVRSR